MKRIGVFILVVCLVYPFSFSTEAKADGNTWYVSPTGSGNECSQANPCALDTAVQLKSASGDTILAKTGDYYASDPSSSYVTYIYKSLKIKGSCTWEATGTVSCAPQEYTSYIKANDQMRGFAIQGIPGDGMSVLIEGFVIMQGNAEGVGPGTCASYYGYPAMGCGGGIYAEGVDNLELRHLYLTTNFGSRSSDNTKSSLGGGIYATQVGRLVLEQSSLMYNQAGKQSLGAGGAAFITDSGERGGILIERNMFYGNEVSDDQDLTYGAGLLIQKSADVTINMNQFYWQNYTHTLTIYGSAIYLRDTSNSYIVDNIFHFNYGLSSIRIEGNGTGLAQVTLGRNQLTRENSAINVEIRGDAEVLLANNFIGVNNPSLWEGAAAGVYSIGGGTIGIPVVFAGLNTFALLSHGLYIEHDSNMTANYNIFTQISHTAVYSTDPAYSTISISENLFHDNIADGITGTTYFTGDPLLLDPAMGDFHIQPGSAAVDKFLHWEESIDIDGQLRPVGPGIINYDLGADEYMLQAFLPVVQK